MYALLLKLHRWVGLIAGIVILVLAVTGCVLVFESDLERSLNSAVMEVAPGHQRVPWRQAVDAVRAAHPGATPAGLVFPQAPHHALLVGLKGGPTVGVDPYRGRVLGTVDRTRGPAKFIHNLHTRFLAGKVGEWIVGGFTVLTLLMAISGVVLWWPRGIWSLKKGRSWRRLNFDLHNVLGLYSAVFLVFITLAGVLIAFEDALDPLVLKLNSAPPRARVQPVSTPVAGVAPISPDEAYRIGQEALPGGLITTLNLPAPGTTAYAMGIKFPEDRTPGGRSRVFVDQYSGQVLEVVSTRSAELGTRILNLKRSVHTGDVFGAPSQAIAFLVSLALAGQVVTGFLIWWKPGRFAVAAPSRSDPRTNGATEASAAM